MTCVFKQAVKDNKRQKKTEFWAQDYTTASGTIGWEEFVYVYTSACCLMYSFQLKDPCYIEQDDLDEAQMQKIEEARKAYVAAVATAKENQDEESRAAAASARLRLQSLVL